MHRDLNSKSNEHQPVMLTEVVEAWYRGKQGIYVDGTFGRGGHSQLLLERLGERAQLLAFDRDRQAVASAARLQAQYPQLDITHGAFSGIYQHLRDQNLIGKVDGILLDLGVSSPQLDNPTRGFSFMRDGPLDMRLDTSSGESAAQWLQRASEKSIRSVLHRLGEEPFAARIASAIVSQRDASGITTTLELADLIEQVIPVAVKSKMKTHPATRSFQAIRIHINDELGELERFFESALEMLRSGGRMVIISFHSLEDRLVKHFFRAESKGLESLSGIPLTEGQMQRTLKLIGGARKARPEEVSDNPRARSAVLRVAEKL